MVKENILINAVNFHRQGKVAEAEKLYKEILDFEPDNESVLYFLGIIAYDRRNLKEAETYFRKLISLNTDSADIYFLLGNICLNNSQIDEAVSLYKKSLAIDPNNEEAHFNLGMAFEVLKDFNSAENCYKNAISLDNTYLEPCFNLANLLYNQKNIADEAIDYYKKALTLNPNIAEIYGNMGYVFYNSKRDPQTAIQCYKKALELRLDMPTVHYNLGRAMLVSGNFDEGWEYFKERTHIMEDYRLKNGPFLESLDNIEGKTIFIYHVAGFGDTMIFARYVPVLASMGAKVICKPQSPLTRLFRQSGWGVEVIDDIPDDNIKFDFQSSFMVLPALFKSRPENIPFKDGYLKANPDKISYFKEKYFNNDKLKVGLVWQCGNAEGFDNNRSVPDLNIFSEILKLSHIKFYSLQKEVSSIDNYDITALGPEFKDFSDTAAAMENCDLIITVDTASAHLSGALGKTTWVLLPYSPHWVWLLNGEDTMWYKGIQLFRQKEPDNWETPIKEIYERLKSF